MQLRPYQQQAIDDLRHAYRTGARAPLLCLPTGAGKTVVFAQIARSAAERGNRVLILVHRRELVRQASDKLATAEVNHGIIASGIRTTLSNVQVASVQTLVRRLDLCKWSPGLIIIDEAHHASSNTWQKILNHWPQALRLGVTATPVRTTGRGLADVFDHLTLGPSVADLIDADFLSHSRIYAPPQVADLSGIRTRAGDYANDQAAAAMDRPTVTGDAIAHYQRLAAGQQAIVFCCNVKHAVSVCDSFKTAGIAAALLLGTTENRDQVVADFAFHRIKLLITVDVVSEGFDVPAASCAILLRPTKSLGLYLQQVGRVLRPAAGKSHAIILDHVGNVTRHGFPDDHRHWSLENGVRTLSGQAAPSVRTCPECYAAFKPQPICPACGANCVLKTHELQLVDGELVELRKCWQPQLGEEVLCTLTNKKYFYAGPYAPGVIRLSKDRDFCFISEPSVLDAKRVIDAHGAFGIRNTFEDAIQQVEQPKPKHKRREQGKARTLSQLLAIAKERGYSPGWAYKIHQARGQRGNHSSTTNSPGSRHPL